MDIYYEHNIIIFSFIAPENQNIFTLYSFFLCILKPYLVLKVVNHKFEKCLLL